MYYKICNNFIFLLERVFFWILFWFQLLFSLKNLRNTFRQLSFYLFLASISTDEISPVYKSLSKIIEATWSYVWLPSFAKQQYFTQSRS